VRHDENYTLETGLFLDPLHTTSANGLADWGVVREREPGRLLVHRLDEDGIVDRTEFPWASVYDRPRSIAEHGGALFGHVENDPERRESVVQLAPRTADEWQVAVDPYFGPGELLPMGDDLALVGRNIHPMGVVSVARLNQDSEPPLADVLEIGGHGASRDARATPLPRGFAAVWIENYQLRLQIVDCCVD
jgi:hypothetical protein